DTVRCPASPVARTPPDDAGGPCVCREQFHASPVVSRDRTVTPQPRDDCQPRRTTGDTAARTEHAASGGGLRAGLSGTVAGGTRICPAGDRPDPAGAQAVSGFCAGSPLERCLVQQRVAATLRR